MALIKQGQQLVDVSQEEAQKATGLTPLSPGAAKAQGATPQQAAMAGTPAAKQPLYKALEPAAPSLQQTQRASQGVLPTGKEQAQIAQQAADKMDRIKQLGTMGTQLQGLIEQKIATLSQQNIAQAQISQTKIDTLPETQRAAATAALQAYAAATDTAAKQQQLVVLANLGMAVDEGSINSYFQQLPELATTATQQAVGTTMTLGQLQPAWLNAPQTAADLGISEGELLAFTPDQLQEKLTEVETQNFDRIEAIKAQMGSATGTAKEALRQELRALGQAGITGTEAQFDRMQQAIDEGQTLTVGGQEMSVEDILTRDSLSTLVSAAATDANKLAELAKTEPALAAWITANTDTLAELASGQREDVRTFGAVQQSVADLQSELGSLSGILVGPLPKYVTQAEVDAAKAALAENGLYQAISQDDKLKAMMQTNPELATQLKDASIEDITLLKNTMETAKLNSGVAAVFGIAQGTIPTDIANAQAFQAAVDAVSEIDSPADQANVAQMIKDGSLTPEFVTSLMSTKPAELGDVMSEVAFNKNYEEVKNDFGKMTSFIFGEGATQKSINTTLEGLARLAPYDTDAKRIYDAFRNITGADGHLDASDMGRMQAAIKTAGLEGIVAGQKTGQQKIADVQAQMQELATYTPKNQAAMAAIQTITGDNVITFEELIATDPANLALLENNAYIKVHFPGAVESIKNINAVKKVFGATPPPDLMASMKDGKIATAEISKLSKTLDLDNMEKLLNSTFSFEKGYKTDARATLQATFDKKVNEAVHAFPEVEQATASQRVVFKTADSIDKWLKQQGNLDDPNFSGNPDDAKNAMHAIIDQIPELKGALEQLDKTISISKGAVKAALLARRKPLLEHLHEANWWAQNIGKISDKKDKTGAERKYFTTIDVLKQHKAFKG